MFYRSENRLSSNHLKVILTAVGDAKSDSNSSPLERIEDPDQTIDITRQSLRSRHSATISYAKVAVRQTRHSFGKDAKLTVRDKKELLIDFV